MLVVTLGTVEKIQLELGYGSSLQLGVLGDVSLDLYRFIICKMGIIKPTSQDLRRLSYVAKYSKLASF